MVGLRLSLPQPGKCHKARSWKQNAMEQMETKVAIILLHSHTPRFKQDHSSFAHEHPRSL